MRRIKFNDFQLVNRQRKFYYSLTLGDVEIRIRRYVDWHDIGIYRNENKSLIYRKVRVAHQNPVVEKGLAIEAVNKLWLKYYKKFIGEDI